MSRAKLFLLPVSVILTALTAGGAVYAHIKLASMREDYTGLLAPLDRLYDSLFVAVIVGITFCVGGAIGKTLKLAFVSVAEEVSFSVMLGTGVVGSCVFGLGICGLLAPVPVAALMLSLVLISHRGVARLPGVAGEAFRALAATKTRWITALLFAALLAVLTLRAALPPHNFDEAIYHLSVTKLFVEEGRLYPVYDNFSGNMPFLLHMIYAVCLIAKTDIGARLFSLCLAVMCALAVYGFCARFLTRRVGTIALFAFFGAGMVVEVAVTSRIDVSLAGMLFMAAYAMMIHLETKQAGWFYMSALLSGFSLGIKYTAGVWILVIGVMFLIESRRGKLAGFVAIVKRGLLYAAVAALIASPWYVKNLVWFNNPIYPFVTGEAAEIGNGQVRYFTPEDKRKLDAHFDAARSRTPRDVEVIEDTLAKAATLRAERHPFRFWEFFTKPGFYNMGAGEEYHEPNYLFLVAPLMPFLGKRKWLTWLGIFSVVFYLAAASTSWIARYLLPVYPALTVLAAYTLSGLAERLRPRARIAAALPVVLVAIAVVSPAFICAVQIYRAGGVGFLTGALSRRDFMYGAFYYPSIDFINRQLPPDARVMMLGAQMSYDMQRDYVADAGWDSIEWQRLLIRNPSLEEVSQDLRRQGITHILFSPGLFKFVAISGRQGSGPSGSLYQKTYLPEGPDYQVQLRNWATFNLYRRDFLELIFTQDEYRLYRIREPAEATARVKPL